MTSNKIKIFLLVTNNYICKIVQKTFATRSQLAVNVFIFFSCINYYLNNDVISSTCSNWNFFVVTCEFFFTQNAACFKFIFCCFKLKYLSLEKSHPWRECHSRKLFGDQCARHTANWVWIMVTKYFFPSTKNVALDFFSSYWFWKEYIDMIYNFKSTDFILKFVINSINHWKIVQSWIYFNSSD
jgi:hypothetical protein